MHYKVTLEYNVEDQADAIIIQREILVLVNKGLKHIQTELLIDKYGLAEVPSKPF